MVRKILTSVCELFRRIFGESNCIEQDSKEPLFSKAVETLQQLKTTFTPLEKLKVVHNTVKQVEQVLVYS